MSRIISSLISLAIFSASAICFAKGPQQSDVEVKKAVIAESISAYPGKCPCPFNVAKNGSSCGGRSAWSKQGGYAPICYEKEVTAEMISKWRAENRPNNANDPSKK